MTCLVQRCFRALLVISAIIPVSLSAQQNVRETLTRISSRIVSHTSFMVIDSSTGHALATVPAGEVRPSVRILSNYNDWTYFNGVILTGMMRVAEVKGDSGCRSYVLDDFRFIFDNLDYFHEQWEVLQVPRASYYRVFRMNMLDDCGAMGTALAVAYRYDRQSRYLAMLRRIANYIGNIQIRLRDGTLARPDPRYMTVWADDLYMSVPFLAQMGLITGEQRYFDDAARQVEGFRCRLTDPETGLLKHAWFSDSGERSIAAWGRANGWAIMAHTELLRDLPATHPLRDSLLTMLRNHLQKVCSYQDSTGLWHQVLDHPESYLETSCSAMFCYGIATAVNRGWLDRSYSTVARKAWNGIYTRIRSDGQVEGICRGTEVGFDLGFYYERPTPLDDPRGIGAILLAGTEMLVLGVE